MAGPGRPGVGAGVATGAAVVPQAASRLKARLLASTEKRRFRFFIGSMSIRKGDSVAPLIVWYVPSDAAARNAPEPDTGRALAAQPHDGLAGAVAGPDRRRSLRLLRRRGTVVEPLYLLPDRDWLDLWNPGGRPAKSHARGRFARGLFRCGGPLHRAGAFVLSKRRGCQRAAGYGWNLPGGGRRRLSDQHQHGGLGPVPARSPTPRHSRQPRHAVLPLAGEPAGDQRLFGCRLRRADLLRLLAGQGGARGRQQLAAAGAQPLPGL